jgi:hypothetical protein
MKPFILNAIPLSLTALITVGIMVIGCCYLVSPERISGTFGLKPPASDATLVPGYVLKEFGTSWLDRSC